MSGTPQDFSFEEQGAAQVAPDALAALNNKLAEAITLKEMVDQMEEDLPAAKQALQALNTQVIPDMMTELGMDEVTQRGWKIKVVEFVSGSLPKDPAARQKAIDWLTANDAGELLKTHLGIDFARSQHNEALAIADDLQKAGLAPNVESTVHPQTLLAFARERIKNGEPLDIEALGLYTGQVAKFKRVGEK